MKTRVFKSAKVFIRRTIVIVGIAIVLLTILPIFLLANRLDTGED